MLLPFLLEKPCLDHEAVISLVVVLGLFVRAEQIQFVGILSPQEEFVCELVLVGGVRLRELS